jgi:hypothetical protein
MNTHSIFELSLKNKDYGTVIFKAFFNNDTNTYLYEYFPQVTMYICQTKTDLKKLIVYLKKDSRFIGILKDNKELNNVRA